MKKRFLKATAVMTALTMLFSGCGSLFMENDMTVSLSSQGTEGVDEMLAQGMEPEEFEIEIYEEDRWSGEITSTAKAFYIDPLANDTMISFELIHHDEQSHVMLYTYQALKKDPAKVDAFDAYYVYVQNNRDASEAYVAARDLYDLKSTEVDTANEAFQDVLAKLTLAQQTYEGFTEELEEANVLYAAGDLSETELKELENQLTKAQQEYTAYQEQKIAAGEVLAKAQKEKDDARKAYEAATEAYEKTKEQVKTAEQTYRNLVGGNTSGFTEADMDSDYTYDPEAEEIVADGSGTQTPEVSAGAVGGQGAPVAPGKLSTGTSGEEKTLLEAVMERYSSNDLLYRAENEPVLELLAETTDGTDNSYVPGTNNDPILADDVGEDDQAALDELNKIQEENKPPEDVTYDSTQGVNGGDELLQDPQVMICEVVMYDYINKRYSSVFKTEAEPNEEKMLYVNLLSGNRIAVFHKGVMMLYVQDSATGGYRQLWKYDMSQYYEPLVKEKVPNLDEWSVENVLSLSGGQDNYLVIRAAEKESEDIADDDDAVAEDLENRTHYLLIRLMADTIYDTGNYFMQYEDGNVYYYGHTQAGVPVKTFGDHGRGWWDDHLILIKRLQDFVPSYLSRFGTIVIDITTAVNWGDDAALKSLFDQPLSTDNQQHIDAVYNAVATSAVPLRFTSSSLAHNSMQPNKKVNLPNELQGYLVAGKYYHLDTKSLSIVENGKSLVSQNRLLGSGINLLPLFSGKYTELEELNIEDNEGFVSKLKYYDQLGEVPLITTDKLHMASGDTGNQEPDMVYYFLDSSEYQLERSQYLAMADRLASLSDYEKAQLYSVYTLLYYPYIHNNHADVYNTIFSAGTLGAPDLEDALGFLDAWNSRGTMTINGDWANAGAWISFFGKGEEKNYDELNGNEFGMGSFDIGENRVKALENYATQMQNEGIYRFGGMRETEYISGYELQEIYVGGTMMTMLQPVYEVGMQAVPSPYSIATGMSIVNDWVDSLREALLDDSEWEKLKLWKAESGGLFRYAATELSAMAGTTLISAKIVDDDYIMLPMDNKSLATLDYAALTAEGGTLLSCAEADFRGVSTNKIGILSGISLHSASFDIEDYGNVIRHEYVDEREFVDGKWLEDGERIINFMLGKEYLRVNRWKEWYKGSLEIFTQNLPFDDMKSIDMARIPIAELEIGIRCGEENAGSMAQNPGAAGSANPSDFGAATDSQLIPNAWSLHILDENAVWKYTKDGEEKTTEAFTVLIAGQSYGLVQATAPWSSYTNESLKDDVYAEQLLPGCYFLLLPSEDPDTFYLIGYDDTTKTYKPSDIAGAGIFKVTLENLQ